MRSNGTGACLLAIFVLGACVAPIPARAQQDAPTVDPDSPSRKEFGSALEAVRREAAATENARGGRSTAREGSAPLFGVGVPRGSDRRSPARWLVPIQDVIFVQPLLRPLSELPSQRRYGSRPGEVRGTLTGGTLAAKATIAGIATLVLCCGWLSGLAARRRGMTI